MSLQEFLPTPKFDEYREFFADFFTMSRRDDGVLLVKAHTAGGPVQLSVQNHRALGQMLKVVGADPDNEILTMCDITIAAQDAVLFDLHYDIGSVPADGIHNAFQELLGTKRAAYALLTGEAIDARKALEYGLVNEVVPEDELIARGFAIADHIMTQPRTIRRLTTQIVRRPWKRRVTDDLDGGFGIQMFGHVASRHAVHGGEHVRSTVDYVREGRKNNFDGRGKPGDA